MQNPAHVLTVKVTTIGMYYQSDEIKKSSEVTITLAPQKMFFETTSIHQCDSVEITEFSGNLRTVCTKYNDGTMGEYIPIPDTHIVYDDIPADDKVALRVVIENSNGKTAHVIQRRVEPIEPAKL